MKANGAWTADGGAAGNPRTKRLCLLVAGCALLVDCSKVGKVERVGGMQPGCRAKNGEVTLGISVRLNDGRKINAFTPVTPRKLGLAFKPAFTPPGDRKQPAPEEPKPRKDNKPEYIVGGERVKVRQVDSTKSGDECWEIIEWLKPGN